MTNGDKGITGTLIDALVTAKGHAEAALNFASDAAGDKLFGPTAESEYGRAEAIKPEASTQPTTVGRRSKGPDGKDPFHGNLAKPDDKVDSKA